MYQKAICVPMKSQDPVIPSPGQKIVILYSLMNYTVIIEQLVSFMSERLCYLSLGESIVLPYVVSHFFTIFFGLNPCETFHSHMWLTTDFTFIYGHTFIYQIQISTDNIVLVGFFFNLGSPYDLSFRFL